MQSPVTVASHHSEEALLSMFLFTHPSIRVCLLLQSHLNPFWIDVFVSCGKLRALDSNHDFTLSAYAEPDSTRTRSPMSLP